MKIVKMFFSILIVVLLVATCSCQEADLSKNTVCDKRNGYYEIEGSCDSYIECRDQKAQDMLCPDGLHFNPAAIWPAYPCGYPVDVPCIGARTIQPAQPTPDCPHLYGFFPHPETSPENCGQYRMCVSGRAVDMECPLGLAFNPDISRCDWPELVESCDVEKFLGFKCPDVPPQAEAQNYIFEGTCQYFFRCKGGRARLLSCDPGLAFDVVSGNCVDSERVQCEEPNNK